MSSLDYLDLCRLCLVKDRVSVPIFEGEGDVRQIFLKIAACLPVKVGREDKLPKKICDDCVYKVELFYQFWNTTANAEKQLLQWLGDVSLDDKQGYVTGAHPSLMKPGQNPGENRLDGSVMQQVNDHPNNMGMGMLDGMGMGMPMMISTSGQQQQSQQQMTSVPMDTGGNSVQTVQAVPGPSTQSSHDQIVQRKTNASTNQEDDEDESEEDENSDDECDGDDGLPVKEESEEDPTNGRTIEPTTFVNVSLACDEAGPSGLQQQKIGEMPEMVMPPTDGDPKSGILCHDSYQLIRGRRSIRLQRTRRLEGIMTEDGITYTNVKKHSMDENVAEIDPRYNAALKRQDDVSVTEEGEELVHLNDDIDEEEVYGDYSCQKCSICFPTWNLLKTHMKSIHEAIQCFKCKICFKVYNNLEPFALHVSLEHANDAPSTDDCLETLTLYRVSRGTSLYTRNKRKHNVQRSLTTIEQTPELLSCSQCDYKTKNKSELAVHVAKHVEDVKFSCKTCGRKFKIRRNLTYHVRFSHREYSCICDVCGKTCANNRSLHTHRKFVHFKGKYECKLCNRLLISQENLDTHMQRQHVEKKPVKGTKAKHENAVCEACGKVFSKSEKLKIHMRVHTGERPFVCAVCKESFARKNSLRQHLLLHTGTKPYVCDICGKAFAQKPGLTGHRRSHPGSHPPLPPVFIGPILDDVLRRCEQ